PVYLDGDSPSAQKLGARFNVTGYPTMILFDPQGREVTRLPGEADGDQYMQVLTMGLNGARPVKETLQAALSGKPSDLRPDDWRMLAYYSWITDDQHLVPKDKLPSTLRELARACPADQAESASRLAVSAVASAARQKGAKPLADPAAYDRLMKLV